MQLQLLSLSALTPPECLGLKLMMSYPLAFRYMVMTLAYLIDGLVDDHNLGYIGYIWPRDIISYTDTTHTSLMVHIQIQIMQLIIFRNKYISVDYYLN